MNNERHYDDNEYKNENRLTGIEYGSYNTDGRNPFDLAVHRGPILCQRY